MVNDAQTIHSTQGKCENILTAILHLPRVFILLFFSWKYTAEVSFEDAYHVLSCGTTSRWHGARTLERIIKSRGL